MFCNPQLTTQVVHTLDVPPERSLLYLEIPKDYDVVENIRCDATGWKISLVGSGSDLIPVENLRIILMNVRSIPIVLRIETSTDDTSVFFKTPQEVMCVSIFYSGLHYPEDKKSLIRRHQHIASYISK